MHDLYIIRYMDGNRRVELMGAYISISNVYGMLMLMKNFVANPPIFLSVHHVLTGVTWDMETNNAQE